MAYQILHISDIHFGAHNPDLVDTLLAEIGRTAPALVIISGDMTQLATSREFKQAQSFISRINAPTLCVPGNHDIPHYHLWQRFFTPYKRYKKYIDRNLCPSVQDERCIAVGVNTARRILPHWNWANGAISRSQTGYVQDKMAAADPALLRIAVCHHPLHIAADNAFKTVVFGARQALAGLRQAKVDLVLSGHAHHASLGILEEDGHRMVMLSATTALSTRLRQQNNGYNLITVNDDQLIIEIVRWDGSAYELFQRHEINRTS